MHMLNELAVRAMALVVGLTVGTALAKYLGFQVGDFFTFGHSGWSWQGGLIAVAFAFLATELAARAFGYHNDEPDGN
jgi:uncharacterized PurR-regulated membrane protein YhhQ (DUF165 family)